MHRRQRKPGGPLQLAMHSWVCVVIPNTRFILTPLQTLSTAQGAAGRSPPSRPPRQVPWTAAVRQAGAPRKAVLVPSAPFSEVKSSFLGWVFQSLLKGRQKKDQAVLG